MYTVDKKQPYIYTMYLNGFYGDKQIAEINNDVLTAAYYATPRVNPYITITDAASKRTFKYINFFGENLRKPYLSAPHWLHDGKRFLCETYESGYIYMYDTETQIMYYIGQSAIPTNGGNDGVVGEEDTTAGHR